MDYNKIKYKKMIKNIKTMHKNIEEHCNYQIIVREVFRRIEEEFDTNQMPCGCEKWCNCWKEFKERILKEK